MGGWTMRDDLPPGWRVRAGKHGGMDFMTPVGKWFPSLSQARALMEKFGEGNFDFSRLNNLKKRNASKENSSSKQKAKTEKISQDIDVKMVAGTLDKEDGVMDDKEVTKVTLEEMD